MGNGLVAYLFELNLEVSLSGARGMEGTHALPIGAEGLGATLGIVRVVAQAAAHATRLMEWQ